MRGANENIVSAHMSSQVPQSQLLMKLKILAVSFEGECQSVDFFVSIWSPSLRRIASRITQLVSSTRQMPKGTYRPHLRHFTKGRIKWHRGPPVYIPFLRYGPTASSQNTPFEEKYFVFKIVSFRLHRSTNAVFNSVFYGNSVAPTLIPRKCVLLLSILKIILLSLFFLHVFLSLIYLFLRSLIFSLFSSISFHQALFSTSFCFIYMAIEWYIRFSRTRVCTWQPSGV